jgi:hypothetical protein
MLNLSKSEITTLYCSLSTTTANLKMQYESIDIQSDMQSHLLYLTELQNKLLLALIEQ